KKRSVTPTFRITCGATSSLIRTMIIRVTHTLRSTACWYAREALLTLQVRAVRRGHTTAGVRRLQLLWRISLIQASRKHQAPRHCSKISKGSDVTAAVKSALRDIARAEQKIGDAIWRARRDEALLAFAELKRVQPTLRWSEIRIALDARGFRFSDDDAMHSMIRAA